MRRNEILLVVFILMLAVVLSSGCTEKKAESSQIMTPAPVSETVDLHMKGFNEFIKGNYPEALDYYNQSIAADPKNARAWMDRGNVLVELNQIPAAIASYDSALAIDNNLAIVWNSRGEALMSLGNYSDARDSFDKALLIAPEYENAKANRDLAIAKIT